VETLVCLWKTLVFLWKACGKPVENLWKTCRKPVENLWKKEAYLWKKNDLQKSCGKLGYFSTDFPQAANSANPLYQRV